MQQSPVSRCAIRVHSCEGLVKRTKKYLIIHETQEKWKFSFVQNIIASINKTCHSPTILGAFVFSENHSLLFSVDF